MPEAKSVEELVFDGGDAVTVGPDGQPLLPDVPVSHRGETANMGGRKSTFSGNNKVLVSCKGVMIVMVLPIALKDRDIICLSTPRFEVDAALETILLKGLQDHSFCIDLCTENKIEDK